MDRCWIKKRGQLGALVLLMAAGACQAISGVGDLTIAAEGSDASTSPSAGGASGAAGSSIVAGGAGGSVEVGGSGQVGGSGLAGSSGGAAGTAGIAIPDASDNRDSSVIALSDAAVDAPEEQRALPTKDVGQPPPTTCYGYCDQFPGAGSQFFSDHLAAVMVSITAASKAVGLGIFTTQDNGQKVILALYTDLGGHPDKLVATSPIAPLALGRNAFNFDQPAAIQPGKYWIAFGLGGTTQVDTSSTVQAQYYVMLLNFGTTPPDTFPIPPPIMPYSSDVVNVFVLTQ